MKSKLFMYLFLFAVLYIIFQYANSKKTFEMQEAKIGSLREKVEALEQTKDSLQNTSVTASSQDGYSLESDDKAKMYIEELGYNIDDFKNFMKQCFGSGSYRVESYGYYAKPTDLANIPYDKVFMCCIKVEKNSKSPGIFIDIVD